VGAGIKYGSQSDFEIGLNPAFESFAVLLELGVLPRQIELNN
jgi:hypothetical protein